MSDRAAPQPPRTALLTVVAAGAFTLVWLVLGFVSTGYELFGTVVDGYSAIAQPISGLGLGSTATAMNAAFVACGVLMTAGVIGTAPLLPSTSRSRIRGWAIALIAASGLGIALCGAFDLESILMHSLGFLLAVALPSVGFALLGLTLRTGDRAASTWLFVAAALGLVLFATFMAIFDPTRAGENSGVAGLTQRVLVVVVTGTIAAVSGRFYGKARR